MKTLSLLMVVSLGLLSGCGPSTVPCNFNRDCVGEALCVKGVCIEREETAPPKKPKDAGVPEVDAGQQEAVDAGAEPEPMLTVDAGVMCTPRRCADVGANCGSIPDGCGGMLACGTCSAPETCGAIHPAQCACVPKTCAQLGASCGSLDDGCGHALSCGTCSGSQDFCNAARACECRPKTCADLGAMCGVNLPDGCGGVIASCGADPSCMGRGSQWTCDQQAPTMAHCVCTPKTCAQLGASCGAISDGCGATLSCGTCGQFYACGASNQCVCASSVDDPDDQFQDTNCDGIDGNAGAAIFVSSASGSDANDGTKARPVQSLAKAFSLFARGMNTVFVAAGTYSAPATTPLNFRLYGGYDTSWNRSASSSARAVITAPTTGWLLSTSTAVIERVVIRSSATSMASESSQALRLVDCGTNVSLRFVDVVAVNGSDGRAGSNGASGSAGAAGQDAPSPTFNNPDWIAPTMPMPAAGGMAASSVARGGTGGIGGWGSTLGGTSGNTYGAPAGVGGIGGCSPTFGVTGLDGVPGAAGARGADGAGLGLVNPVGVFVPAPTASGSPGAIGNPGQGGGGGGGGGKLHCFGVPSRYQAGGFGGGGGAGGEAGYAGTGGTVGGSSIAMMLVRSNPVMFSVNVIAGNPGRGGTGGAGGAGGYGGSYGMPSYGVQDNGVSSGRGGRGGYGGHGGAGGAGGNGANGVSFGIWCTQVTGLVGGANPTVAPGGSATYGCP